MPEMAVITLLDVTAHCDCVIRSDGGTKLQTFISFTNNANTFMVPGPFETSVPVRHTASIFLL